MSGREVCTLKHDLGTRLGRSRQVLRPYLPPSRHFQLVLGWSWEEAIPVLLLPIFDTEAT